MNMRVARRHLGQNDGAQAADANDGAQADANDAEVANMDVHEAEEFVVL
jgi:hypothetical protein